MTNEEKARQIALENLNAYFEDDNHIGITSEGECYYSAMAMAKWKDEQFAKEKEKVIEDACEKIMQQAKDDYKFIKKEKQQWIERACKYIKKNVCEHINHNPLYKDYKHEEKIGFQLVVDEHFYIDFKKTMEEL